CGQAPLSPSVLQGDSAQEGSWPWQASLHLNGQYLCGGSLINSNWVLTAAYCFYQGSTDASRWTVYLGRQTQLGSNPHEVSRMGQTISFYPTDDMNVFDDIALLKLDSPVSFTSYIQPICLADSSSSFYNCTSCWFTGWVNMTGGGRLIWNETLQQTQLPLIEITACANFIEQLLGNSYLTESMICAGVTRSEMSSCWDENNFRFFGNPLVCKQESSWTLAGVVNRYTNCGKMLVIYSGVSNYKSWIKNQAGLGTTDFVFFGSNSICNAANVFSVTTTPDTSTASLTTTTSTTTGPVGDSAVSLLFSVQVCGRPRLNTSLLGGQSAAEGSWPWMASLQRNGRHVCGGTLVTGDWVMTTAQCLSSPVIVQEWTVILGRLKQNGSNPFERSLGVQSVQTSQLGGTNIALLKLDTKVSFTDYIQPICLAGERVSFPTGAQCWVTGWGNATGTGENTLQQVSTAITECVNVSSADNLCTGSLDLQQGDSGDPLVCQQDSLWIQASIVAVDNTVQLKGRVARALQQGVFPKVSRYQSFLQSNVGPTLPLINPNTVVTTTPTPSNAPSLGHTVLLLAVLSLMLTTWISTS
ncbi:TMPS9 protease, partial [Atractosteus spatula]|nr:TMPS9 protease [Atractosteus spatula]